MAENNNQPVLNPVLKFIKDARPENVTGGGKNADAIVRERLATQRRALSGQMLNLSKTVTQRPQFNNRTLLYAAMFDDSLATSWTPGDLFQPEFGAQLVAPYKLGYLVEILTDTLPAYAKMIENTQSIKELVDITHIESISFFDPTPTSDDYLDKLWNAAPVTNNGRLFVMWLTPFKDTDAAEALIQLFGTLRGTAFDAPPALLGLLEKGSMSNAMRRTIAAADGDRLNLTMREYRQRQRARTTVVVRSRDALLQLVTSGSVFRIEPTRLLTTTAPGEGTEPARPLPTNLADMPIVGIIDGGLTANSYQPAEAWRSSPYISDAVADHRHGNQITSLVVQGHDWNNNLQLPSLYCRVGTVQAIAKKGSAVSTDTLQFITYLDSVFAAYPDTRVWNLSFNEMSDCDTDNVSHLGHELALLARKHNVLLVNSVGNKPGDRLQPPADCEAALTIGGRLHDSDGNPGGPCQVSQPGPGPSSMLKPDASNFSQVRAIGGVTIHGSSFSTALTSPLAAHTMARLREPSPDLAKALLLHRTDLDAFAPNLGFGTPQSEKLPWECQAGFVTLQWTASLRPKFAYYWELPIPPSLRKSGKLKGMGVLTAVLNPHPLVSDYAGPNYFSARLNTALQCRNGQDKEGNPKYSNLLGSLKTDVSPELKARTDDHKWCPVRHHKRVWKNGVSFEGNSLRVYARAYTRDLYLYDDADIDASLAMNAVFVLTLGTGKETDDVYNELRDQLGAFVESSILDTEIDIDHS